jgi:hypothetical protein
VLFKIHMIPCKRHKDFEAQFETLWSSTPSSSSGTETTKASTRNSCDICYHIVDIDTYGSYEKTIDSLKIKVNSLETKVQEKKKTSEDEKIEYANSAYMNERWPHVKSGIVYKEGDKHNARVNNKGKEFVKKSTTNHSSYASKINANASHVAHMSYHDCDESYILMKNKHDRVITKFVESLLTFLIQLCKCTELPM